MGKECLYRNLKSKSNKPRVIQATLFVSLTAINKPLMDCRLGEEGLGLQFHHLLGARLSVVSLRSNC